MIRATLIALCLAGCAPYNVDPLPPPPSEKCQIWVRVDGGAWRCYNREKTLRDLCKITGC